MKNCGSTGLKPRVFYWPCEHSTTELPSHPVISPTTFYLNPTRLHTSLGTLNLSTYFMWGNPRRTYRLNNLSTVCFFMLGAICKSWFFLARPLLKPRAFRWPWEHSTTELPRHPVIWPTTFHLNPTPTLVTYAI